MQHGSKTFMNNNPRQPRSGAQFGGRPKRWQGNPGRDRPRGPHNGGAQNARQSYERYLALARAEVLAGDIVAAENYFQHAEHYFRMMSPAPATT